MLSVDPMLRRALRNHFFGRLRVADPVAETGRNKKRDGRSLKQTARGPATCMRGVFDFFMQTTQANRAVEVDKPGQAFPVEG